MLLPDRNVSRKAARALFFAKKVEENTQKHAAAGIAVALNIFVLALIGNVTVRRSEGKRGDVMDANIENFIKPPAGKPPGGGGGSEALAQALTQMNVASVPTPTVQAVVTTTVPNALQFALPTATSVAQLANAMASVTASTVGKGGNGQGTGQGNGNGAGIGPGSGTGQGGGQGAGQGQGKNDGEIDRRIPVILIYTEYNSINWYDPSLKESENESSRRMDKVLKEIYQTFRVVAMKTTRNNNAQGNTAKGTIPFPGSEEEMKFPDSTDLKSPIPTNGRLVLDLAQAHPEAAAIIFCGGWEDGSTTQGSHALGEELGRRLTTLNKQFYMMTFSKSKGFSRNNPFEKTAKVAGGGFKNSAKDIAYELGKTYVPPQ